MNTEQFNENESPAQDELNDEQFLQEFNREFWHLFKKADDYTQKIATSQATELFQDKMGTKDFAVLNSGQPCLSIVRCAEIGEEVSPATETEKSHLQDCRYCERIVLRFAGQSPTLAAAVEINDSDKPKILLPVEQKLNKTLRKWLFPNLREVRQSWLGLSPATIRLAILLLVTVGGVMFILIQFNLSGQNDIASFPTTNAPEESVPPLPQKSEAQANSGSPIANSTDLTPSISSANTSPKLPKTSSNGTEEIVESKGVKKQNPSNSPSMDLEANNSQKPPRPRSNKPNEELASNLYSLDRMYILESLKRGEIIPDESDLKILLAAPTRSAKENIVPISPKNEATIETYPNIRWQGPGNFEYKFILIRRDGKSIPDFKVKLLSQNSVQVEKELAPGFYFWRIAVRPKGGQADAPFEPVPGQIMFKVLSEKEKQRLDRAVRATKSNLVRAILYARAGFLKRAEIELIAELDKKSPNSSIAMRMLAQVQDLLLK